MISDLNLTIEPGERVLLAGPSGAGKSTLLRAAAGLLGAPSRGDAHGQVLIDGAPAGSRPVGLLLQNAVDAVVADTVGRDVAFGPENLRLPRQQIWRRVTEALELVGFPYGPATQTRTLSGGEMQRMALAGALAMKPGLLLLDEPTAMLDSYSAAVVRAAVDLVVAATGATLIVVEHRLDRWFEVVDRMLVLDAAGRLICDDAPHVALTRYRPELERAGLWLPGLPPPRLAPVAAEHVRPTRVATGRLLSAEALGVRLRTRSLRWTREHRALDGVHLTIAAGRVHGLTGRSGAGKSTLLSALAGLIPPTTGAVRAGRALADGLPEHPHRWRSRQLAERIGWLPQNAELALVTRRVDAEVRATADRLKREVDVSTLLEAAGLDGLHTADPYRLSGGEQRRLALVAAFAHRPTVALLDEPTVGQDRNTWAVVAGWVAAMAAAGCAVGVATHDDDLLREVADETTALADGRVAEVG